MTIEELKSLNKGQLLYLELLYLEEKLDFAIFKISNDPDHEWIVYSINNLSLINRIFSMQRVILK